MKRKTTQLMAVALSLLMIMSLLSVSALANDGGNTYYLSDYASYGEFRTAAYNNRTDTFIIDADLTIEGQPFYINAGVTVIINAGMTVEMQERVSNSGTLINNGTISGDNELTGSGTFVNNGEICMEDGRLRIYEESTFTNNGAIDVYTIYCEVMIDNNGGSVICTYFYNSYSTNIGGISNYGGFIDVFYFEGTINNYGGTLKIYAGLRTVVEWTQADYIALDEALEAADMLDEADYTAGSWAALAAAVAAGKAIARIDGWIPEAAQNGIDEMVTTINGAIGALVKRPTFVPVTGIETTEREPVPQEMFAGFFNSIQIVAYSIPYDATHRSVEWVVKDDGGAGVRIDVGLFGIRHTIRTERPGTIVLTAIVANGLGNGMDYTEDFTIIVLELITDKSALTKVVERANALTEAHYTSESWSEMRVFYNSAITWGFETPGTPQHIVDLLVSALEESIDALIVEDGHGELEATTAPTCESEGLTVITCTRCDYREEITLEKLEHIFGDGDITDPTCTDGGYTTFTCKLCDYSYIEDEVAAQPCGDCDLCNSDVTITGVAGAKFVEIAETSKNSREWKLTFKVTVIKSDGSREDLQYSIILKGNNANLDGKHIFEAGHDLAGYTLTYDVKGNGSNIKAFSIK